MSTPTIPPAARLFASRDALYDALTRELEVILTHAVEARSRASLAVPGGTTPVPLFERLARLALPWHSVWVTLTDERWVDTADPDSNEGQLRRCLARERAAGVCIVGLKSEDADPGAALAACSERLARLRWPLDAVVLGMGEDGHIASLFPGAVDLAVALDLGSRARCVAVSPPASAVAPTNRRISLTLAALVDTQRLILLAMGATKRTLLDRVAAAVPEASALPVGVLLGQRVTPAEIWWAP